MNHRTLRLSGGAALLACAAAGQTPLSIRVSNESAPAGGVAQIKVLATEPMPISKGSTTFSLDRAVFDQVLGVHLLSPAGDAIGAAVVQGGSLTVRFHSRGARLGTSIDYPMLTVAVRLRRDAPLGTVAPVALPGTWFAGLLGQLYAAEIAPGSVTVADRPAISNVVPGAGMVPAGSQVIVEGMGFQPGAAVKVDGVEKLRTEFVSPGRLRISAPADTNFEGRLLRLRNPDGSRAEYYAYMRSAPIGSSSIPLLARTTPVFSSTEMADWAVPVAGGPGYSTVASGFAVENAGTGPANVALVLYDATRTVRARYRFTLPAGARLCRGAFELFAGTTPQSGTLRVTADVPVRVMGLIGIPAAGIVEPVFATPAAF